MNQKGDQSFIGVFEHGMTLRDYFAAYALQALLSRGDGDTAEYSKRAYQFAYAMLVERERRQ